MGCVQTFASIPVQGGFNMLKKPADKYQGFIRAVAKIVSRIPEAIV
jgi:hypothetical protein